MISRCDRCPVAEAAGACLPRRLGARRLCELAPYRAAIAAWGGAGGPDAPGPPPPDRLEPPPGLPDCRRRSARWNCGGEMALACALGRGQAGVIEPEDCRGCPDRLP